jgi:hypothetical protein
MLGHWIMRTSLGFSYVLLWGLVVAEAVILREALHSTVWLKRFYTRLSRPIGLGGLPSGTQAPEFSAPMIGTGRDLHKDELKGDPTILLFLSPMEVSLAGYQELSIAIHALWHRMEGRIYLVCSGSEEACRRFALDQQVHGIPENQVPMVLDDQANIARSFQIDSTPMAVELDEDVVISRYGRPVVRSAV